MLGAAVVVEVVVELVVVEVDAPPGVVPPVLVEVTPLELVPAGPGVELPEKGIPLIVVTRV